MKYTENYGFNQPQDVDTAQPFPFNENFYYIDKILKEQEDNIKECLPEQTYQPESNKPQSGIAVAQAVGGFVPNAQLNGITGAENIVWQKGAIASSSGENNDATSTFNTRIRTVGKFPIKENIVISSLVTDGLYIFFYNGNTYISGKGWITSISLSSDDIPDNATHYRLVARANSNNDTILKVSDVSSLVQIYSTDSIKGQVNELNEQINEKEVVWVVGTLLSATGEINTANQTRICVEEYLPFKDNIFILAEDREVFVCFYDANKSFLSGKSVAFTSEVDFSNHVDVGATYYRIAARYKDNRIVTDIEDISKYIKIYVKGSLFADVEKLKAKTKIDNEMSDESENAVQNKVIKAYVDNEVKQIDDQLNAERTTFYPNWVKGAVTSAGVYFDRNPYRVAINDFIPFENSIQIVSTDGRDFAVYFYRYADESSFMSDKSTSWITQCDFSSFPENYAGYFRVTGSLGENDRETTVETIADVSDYITFTKGSLKKDVDELKASVKRLPFAGKTILFDGDSITYGDTVTITQRYSNLVADNLGATLVNKAINGSTLASGGDDTQKRPLVLRYDTQITSEEASNIDIVYIAIGSNDWSYAYTPVGTMEDRVATTFYGALHLLCQGLLQKYIGKPIIFATPIKRKRTEDATVETPNSAGNTLKDYCDIIKEVCDYYSIPVLDMYSESCITPFIDLCKDMFFTQENSAVHPNAEGHKVMARRITAYLKSVISY